MPHPVSSTSAIKALKTISTTFSFHVPDEGGAIVDLQKKEVDTGEPDMSVTVAQAPLSACGRTEALATPRSHCRNVPPVPSAWHWNTVPLGASGGHEADTPSVPPLWGKKVAGMPPWARPNGSVAQGTNLGCCEEMFLANRMPPCCCNGAGTPQGDVQSVKNKLAECAVGENAQDPLWTAMLSSSSNKGVTHTASENIMSDARAAETHHARIHPPDPAGMHASSGKNIPTAGNTSGAAHGLSSRVTLSPINTPTWIKTDHQDSSTTLCKKRRAENRQTHD